MNYTRFQRYIVGTVQCYIIMSDIVYVHKDQLQQLTYEKLTILSVYSYFISDGKIEARLRKKKLSDL